MFKYTYKMYHDRMNSKWLSVLRDLALNRFTWDFGELNGDSSFFEQQLLDYNGGAMVKDNELGYLFLGAMIEDYNIYKQPVSITALGYDYDKRYGSILNSQNVIQSSFAYCKENNSNMNLKILISDYSNDLANIDTTLFFLIKKLKQPYIWKVSKDEQLTANIIQSQLDDGDVIETDEDFKLEEKLSLLNLNVSNQAIQELEILKNQKYSEILQLIGITTVEYEKSERLTFTEANINNQRVNRFLSSSFNARLQFIECMKKVFNVETVKCEVNNEMLVVSNCIIDNNNYSPIEPTKKNYDESDDDYER